MIMKNLFLIIIILITFGCKKDIPNLYTSVEGNVTDYYSKQPVPDIPILVIERPDFCFWDCDMVLDTLFSDIEGYFFFEFYNDSSRYYLIEFITTESYIPFFGEQYEYGNHHEDIVEGKKNICDFVVKPFRELHLKCINQSNKFSIIYIVNLEKTHQRENFYDDNFKNCETVLHIIPEKNVNVEITLYHINELNSIDDKHTVTLDFFAGKNDTTITCYY